MGCKQLFVNLGGSVNSGVLQVDGGVPLDSTLRFVEDQNGTNSPLKLSTTAASLFSSILQMDFYENGSYSFIQFGDNGRRIYSASGSSVYIDATSGLVMSTTGAQQTNNSSGFSLNTGGSITQNGALTIKGAGGNIISGRSSGNVETFFVANSGYLYSGSSIVAAGSLAIGSGSVNIIPVSSGVFMITDAATTGFSRLILGPNSTTSPAIKKSSTDIHFRTGDDTAYTGITAGRSTEKTLEVTEVSGEMGLGFFNTPAINQITTAVSEGSWTSGGGGSNLKTDDTYLGYTIGQVIQAIKNYGLLA